MEEIEEKLSEAGYKITKPRKLILGELFSNKKPVSAQELFKKIKKVDQVSVYRVLGLLEDLGIVNAETLDKEKVYCLSGSPHHHILCRKCGDVEKFECKHNFSHYKNFTNIHHQMILTGICAECAH